MTMPALSFEAVTKRFGRSTVLDKVSFEIPEGGVACLLGPSGSGKSTALRIAAGVETPDGGCVHVGSQCVASSVAHVPAEKRPVGLMFQDFALFPHLTVAENVGFGVSGAKDPAVAPMLERVGLAGYGQKYPHQLSGGEQQRVALARAIVTKPRILLMDEPFSGLDDRLRDTVREACLQITREAGMSVLIVTHDPTEAMRVADVIALMRKGKIVQQGAPFNIYNNPADREAAAFFSDINDIEGKVKNGQVATPFGSFLTPGHNDGDIVDIIIRPQHIKIDFDRNGRGPSPTPADGTAARGVVRRARFLGRESLIEFEMDFDASCLQVSVPNVFLPPEGKAFWLSVRRDRAQVFSRPKVNM